MLITPSGVAKDRLDASELVTMTLDGEVLEGPKASSEWRMHAWAYKSLEYAGAVLHTHAPVLTSLSLRGLGPAWSALGEVGAVLGRVGVVGRMAPGSEELARAVARELEAGAKVVVMAGHGVVSVGRHMQEAWVLMDKAEHSAGILERAGAVVPLDEGPGTTLEQRIKVQQLPLTSEWLSEKRWKDNRGEIHLVLGEGWVGSLGVIQLRAGTAPRGQHYHEAGWEGVYVVKGQLSCVLECVQTRQRLELMLEPGSRLWIPPKVAHALIALKDSWAVEFSDCPQERKATRPWKVV